MVCNTCLISLAFVVVLFKLGKTLQVLSLSKQIKTSLKWTKKCYTRQLHVSRLVGT